MSISGRQPIVTILLVQAFAGASLAGVLGFAAGMTAGVSALLGCAVAVLPNTFLAARLLMPPRGADGRTVLRALWLGEMGKLAMTAVLFVAVFVAVRPLSVPAVFGGYIAAQLVVFCAPLIGGRWLDENGKAEV